MNEIDIQKNQREEKTKTTKDTLRQICKLISWFLWAVVIYLSLLTLPAIGYGGSPGLGAMLFGLPFLIIFILLATVFTLLTKKKHRLSIPAETTLKQNLKKKIEIRNILFLLIILILLGLTIPPLYFLFSIFTIY